MTLQGPYTLVAKLGEGGMAEVFKAVKTGPEGFQKAIALKRILPFFADNEEFIQMLSAEARLHAHLDHPNIVQILDFFRQGHNYLIALEYVPGKNLRQIEKDAERRGHSLSWQAAVHVVAEILKGLDFAHKRKGSSGPLRIVHRDVSPQNILISYEGLVKLSDFGIARARLQREETDAGLVKGKQRYSAPEQLKTGDVDFRADLFSAGVVLDELIRGLRPNVPVPIDLAISKALQTNPTDRHADASEFRRALLSAQDPPWIARGTEELREFMDLLYPKTKDREESSIQQTPMLPLADLPRSLISGVAEISWRGVNPAVAHGWRVPVLTVLTLSVLVAGWYWSSGRISRLPADRSASVAASVLQSGTLVVEGPDGMNVFLNGRPVGRLPLGELSVTPGNYVVLFRGPEGRSSMSRVTIAAGKKQAVRWKASSQQKRMRRG